MRDDDGARMETIAVGAPEEITAAELAAAADANFAAHAAWVQRRTGGMRVHDGRGLLVVDSGLPCDTFNLVLGARLEAADAAARVRETVAYFAEVGRPFSWWVGPADRPAGLGGLLEEAGLERAESEVAMAASLSELRSADTSPGGLRIVRVRTPEQLRDFARVTAASWTPPDPQVVRFYELTAPALLGPGSPLRLYTGYLDGQAVATAELAVEGGVAGLYGIATLAAYRRRGFGTALTLLPLLDAREQGLRTAVLQASSDGAGVYERLGFRPFGQVTEYKPRASGAPPAA